MSCEIINATYLYVLYLDIYAFPQLKKMGMRVEWGVSCKTINAALYAGQHIQCNPLRNNVIPRLSGYIGHVASIRGSIYILYFLVPQRPAHNENQPSVSHSCRVLECVQSI